MAFAVGQQNLGAGDPVSALTMDQMRHYIEGAPRIGAFGSPDPGLRKVRQEMTEDHRSPGQERERILKGEFHPWKLSP